jgi:uncharacterized membrane protein
MKITKSFWIMFLIWVLGYTHFLGGPYVFFKVIFLIAIFPFIFSAFLFILLLLKTRKTFNRSSTQDKEQETIHVDAVIKE